MQDGADRAARTFIDGEWPWPENEGVARRRAAMKLVQRDSVWLLIDETAPEEACVIATLQGEVEVLALREFCRLYLRGDDRIPEHFAIKYRGADYRVTPLGAVGEKLSLVICGNGYASTVATEFAMPDKGEAP
jgi:hypothetical protein